MRKVFFVFMSLLMCSSLSNAFERSDAILGSAVGANGVSIQVYSGGCTQKESFEIYSSRSEPVVQIEFRRRDLDQCLARLPYGVWLQYSYEELGLQPGQSFVIVNPISPFIVPH